MASFRPGGRALLPSGWTRRNARGTAFVGAAGLVALTLVDCSVVTPFDGLSGGEPDGGGQGLGSSAVAESGPGGEGSLMLGAPGTDGGGGRDSAPGAPAPPPSDAAHGGPPTDATIVDSSAPDVSGGGVTDAGTSTVLFSDDFEGPQALPRGWDTLATSDGSLALDATTWVSPSTSLRATALSLPAGAPGNAANVTVRKRFAMPAPQATVAYDFNALVSRYDTANGANVVIGAFQVLDAAGDLYELQLDLGGANAGAFTVILAEFTGRTDGGSTYVAHPVTATFPAGAWTAVRVEVTASQPPIARLYFNQTLEIETSLAIPITGSQAQISLGLSYVSAPSQEWIVNYDDAVYRAL